MGIKYFLTHEYKEKWSLVWRFAVLSICIFVGMLVSGIMMDAYNEFLMFLGLVLLCVVVAAEFLVIAKIMINIVASKYLDNKKFSIKELSMKVLALFVFSILAMIVFSLYTFVCGVLMATGILAMIGIIAFIIGIFLLITYIFIFMYAILETLAKQDYGFRSVFSAFKEMHTKVFKQVLKTVLKVSLAMSICFVIIFIIYFLMLILIISLLFNGSLFLTILASILLIGLVFVIAAIFQTTSIQYIVNYYFTKLAPENNSQSKTNEQFVNVNEEQVTINE